MDDEALARQLIRKLRGKRSQTALSRRLGFKTNVVYAWEAGRRWPTAAGFFRLAERVGVDLDGGLGRFLGGMPEELEGARWTEPETPARLLDHLRGATTIVELSRRVGKNRVSVSRWLQGTAEPRLPDFLRLIGGASLRLLDFLRVFAHPAELPAARAAWETLERQRTVAYDLPWSHAVLRTLELTAYRRLPRHVDGWIARRLQIDEEEEQRCLTALAAAGLIRRRRRKWVATEVLTVDTRQDPAAGRRLKRHWAGEGLERLESLEPNREDLFSYNLFTVSEADWERLRELHIGYFQELRRIVAESSPAERVVLVNLQLFRLDERPSGGRARGEG